MRQSEEKIWAVVSHLGSLVFPFTALIIYFVNRDRSRYVTHHAHQAMWFFFTAWIVGLVLSALPSIGWILASALGIAVFCLAVIASVNALAGHYWEYPIVGRIWRRALGNN